MASQFDDHEMDGVDSKLLLDAVRSSKDGEYVTVQGKRLRRPRPPSRTAICSSMLRTSTPTIPEKMEVFREISGRS